ncbi:MAG: hypothetical protein AAB583_01685 [Patescibacteria group bacterium]
MVWIRIFRTRKEAEWAKDVLEEGGIYSSISEDNLDGVPIQRYNVPARFRLNVDYEDLRKAAKYLAKKLKNRIK